MRTQMVRVSKSKLIIAKANRYNHISCMHMVKIRKYEHFTREKLKMLLDRIDKVELFSVERLAPVFLQQKDLTPNEGAQQPI